MRVSAVQQEEQQNILQQANSSSMSLTFCGTSTACTHISTRVIRTPPVSTLMCAVLEIFWLTSGRLRIFLALCA